MKTILGSSRDHCVAAFGIFLITVALVATMVGCLARVFEIKTWHDLDAVRDNLGSSYILMNDLDSTTPGYGELAGPNANGGKGWEPIGTTGNEFTGTFDGQGYAIEDLFINRPDENDVGLFGIEGGLIKNVGVVNATVAGNDHVGGLVGRNGAVDNKGRIFEGTVSTSYSTGNVSGNDYVGGLVGYNWKGSVSKCFSTSGVAGEGVGGLVGENDGAVSNSYSTGSVEGIIHGGGLVAWNSGTVNNCYSIGSVTRIMCAGGLVLCHGAGLVDGNDATVNNCFWDTENSGQSTSAGGTGKTTAEMQDIDTFTDTGTEGLDRPWDITAVAPGETNDAYTWNIVDSETYPFLCWQS